MLEEPNSEGKRSPAIRPHRPLHTKRRISALSFSSMENSAVQACATDSVTLAHSLPWCACISRAYLAGASCVRPAAGNQKTSSLGGTVMQNWQNSAPRRRPLTPGQVALAITPSVPALSNCAGPCASRASRAGPEARGAGGGDAVRVADFHVGRRGEAACWRRRPCGAGPPGPWRQQLDTCAMWHVAREPQPVGHRCTCISVGRDDSWHVVAGRVVVRLRACPGSVAQG